MTKPELIPSRGAVAEPLLLEVERALTAADISRLADAPKVSVPILQRLRATHHRQAQLLASGKSVKEVAAIVGCTPQRLTQLQVDPTFTELVAYYLDQTMVAMIEDGARLRDKIVDVGEMAVDELRDRLDDDGKRRSMHVAEVRKIAELLWTVRWRRRRFPQGRKRRPRRLRLTSARPAGGCAATYN